MGKDYDRTGTTGREVKSFKRTLSYGTPKRGCWSQLVRILLFVCISSAIIVSLPSIFEYFSDPPEQKTTPKTDIEKREPVKERAKQEKTQKESPASTPARVYEDQGEDGLIAFYPFNGNADDESGNGNHGAVHGATLTEDRFGNADSSYRFDGLDDYIDVGRPLVSGDFTISFWLRSNGLQNRFAVPISQGSMAYRGFGFIFSKTPYNGFSWGSSKGRKTSDANWGKSAWHTLNFHFQQDISKDVTWHHLLATRRGAIIVIFRDGVYQDSLSDFPINYGRFKFNIGRASRNKDFNHRSFKGDIDDVRIYNRHLNEEEIRVLYQEGGDEG